VLLLSNMEWIENPEGKIDELILKLRTVKGFNILKEINLWKKDYWVDISTKKISELTSKINNTEVQNEILQLETEKRTAVKNNDNEALKAINNKLKCKVDELNESINTWKTFNLLNENESELIANKLINWENIDDILIDIRRNNSSLDEHLNQVEKENEKKLNIWENSVINSKEDINLASIPDILKEDKRINLNNGQPEIITKKWNNAQLSENDLLSIQQNPDNLENIINCCNIMNDTWFWNLWDWKDHVFKSISNSIWIWFNLDGDYLNINEIRIMFNTILKSLWYPEINWLADEDTIRNYIKNINGVQVWWETKDANKAGDSKLEDEFFKKYFPKNSTFWFKSSKFEQAIS